MTADNDEAICTSCWVNTENFHVFYESIKNAQHCYSSDEEDHGNNGLIIDQQHQLVQQVEVLNSDQMDPNNGIVNYTIHDEYESVGKHLDGNNEMSMDMMMLVEQQEPMTYVEEIIQSPDQMCSQMIGTIATIRERTISISSGDGQYSQNADGKCDIL